MGRGLGEGLTNSHALCATASDSAPPSYLARVAELDEVLAPPPTSPHSFAEQNDGEGGPDSLS